MAQIHPSAVVEPGARLADDVVIGPFCMVGPEVDLASGVHLVSHVTVAGRTSIGENTRIYPFSSIGHPPQDLKYKGEASRLIIGRNNTIRENVTMNPGTEGGGMITSIGDDCLFMASTHVAHDCRIGNNVIFANLATVAGHVIVGDHAVLGGLCAAHQFVRIGSHAMIGAMTGVFQDVIPFGSVIGNRARLHGLNIVGMKRRGFSREDMHAVRHAYRNLFFEAGTLAERLPEVAARYENVEAVRMIVEFLNGDSDRGVCLPVGVDGDGA